MIEMKVCKRCGRELELTLENWVFDRERNDRMRARTMCRDCHNAVCRERRAAGITPGREATAAQIENGWSGSNSPKGRKAAAAAGFTPGVRKPNRRKVRRNPEVRLEMQGMQWLVRMCADGQWWPATDVEVELWLRLEER